jgi:hypothetical protein
MRIASILLKASLLLAIVISLDSCRAIAKSISKNKENFHAMGEKEFTQQEIDLLKNSTTLFLLRQQDMKQRAKFEKAINEAWDFTPVRVIGYEELENVAPGRYSVFTMAGYNTAVSGRTIAYNIPHLYLTLSIRTFDKEGEVDQSIDYCRIELFMDAYTGNVVTSNDPDQVIDMLYARSTIKNWTPGMLTLYLKEVQQNLERSRREWLYQDTEKEQALTGLKRDTLFAPHYVLTKYNKFTGSEAEQIEAEDLFKKYPYPYKVVYDDELSELILAGKARYVFDYVRSTTDNFIRVYDTQKGKIYQKYEPKEYNLKAKYLKRIVPE